MTAPFTPTVPNAVRDPLVLLQYQRLHELTPLLCLAIAATAVAMAMAVMGDLPLWQQVAPPAIIVSACAARLVSWRKMASVSAAEAWQHLKKTVIIVGSLGLLTGLWSVNAFDETDKYYCMVAPVFLCMAAVVSATCLTSVPGAARAAMFMACAPMVVRLVSYDNLGVRSMGVILVLIVTLQLRLVRMKFVETERMLILQHDIAELADVDALTGLKNRRAFARQLQARLDSNEAVAVAMFDLDGFKAANDSYGHHAGDAVLISVAERLKAVAVSGLCIARLGGDEFAILFAADSEGDQLHAELEAVRAMIALPHRVDDDLILISASIGVAHSADTGNRMAALLQSADRALYADKRRRKAEARRATA